MFTSLLGRRFTVSGPLAIALALAAVSPAKALIITTTDAGVISTFQAGGTIEHFDDLTGLTITSYAAGQTVPTGAQFSTRNGLTQPTFHSGGASPGDPVGNPGTPIGIFSPSAGIAGDVKSPNNVAGPLVINTDEAFHFGFMEIIFPATVSRVGFWLTHGSVTLQLRDITGNALTTGDVQVTATAGQFVGISRDSADITVAALVGSTEAFTIDDLTYGASNGTSVPDAGGTFLSLTFAAAFLCFANRAFQGRNAGAF